MESFPAQKATCEVFKRRHSWIFRGGGKRFDNTILKQFSIAFSPCKLLLCFTETLASHCVRYSAARFSLKNYTEAGYFSCCFEPKF